LSGVFLGDQAAEQRLNFGMVGQSARMGKIKMEPRTFEGGGAGALGDIVEGAGGHGASIGA